MEIRNKKYENIYEPVEDSKLLLKYSIMELNFFNNSNLDILEIGVGSSFVISNLQKNFPQNNYFGTDINPFAIEFSKYENKNINLKLGNLFTPFKEKSFDLILFNTPYFPIENSEKLEDLSFKDRAIYGGKKGYETIENFIIESKIYFKKNAIGIMIFSSLSNFDQIKKILEENLFEFEILEEENSFFEKIYCLKFYPRKVLLELKKKGISNINFLSKGKHSIVLDGIYNNNKVVIKIGKFDDIQIENKFLEFLKNESFIPKLFLKEKNYSIMEKLFGKTIKEFLENSNKYDTIKVFNKIFKICKILDDLKINKSEMTNPYKHIFIDKNLNIKMIDYERCLFTNKTKNTTQFLQYIRRNINILKDRKIFINEKKILEFSKKYKNKSFKIKIEELSKVESIGST